MKQHEYKIKQPYTFTGREWDKEIELYYYRARYYDPEVGRFVTRDPSLYLNVNPEIPYLLSTVIKKPQELALYTFVINNPIRFLDPFGLNNIGNYYFYAGGVWKEDTTFEAHLGQIVIIKVNNVNVLGTTIMIESNSGQSYQMILLPQQRHEFKFSKFGCEPTYWKFDISTQSDAFIVTYEIWSTWIPGMPPNR